jgi:hypothetical protein
MGRGSGAVWRIIAARAEAGDARPAMSSCREHRDQGDEAAHASSSPRRAGPTDRHRVAISTNPGDDVGANAALREVVPGGRSPAGGSRMRPFVAEASYCHGHDVSSPCGEPHPRRSRRLRGLCQVRLQRGGART